MLLFTQKQQFLHMINGLERPGMVGSGLNADVLTERDVLSCIARVLGVCEVAVEDGATLLDSAGREVSRNQLESAYGVTTNRFARALLNGWLEDCARGLNRSSEKLSNDERRAAPDDTLPPEVDGPNPAYDTEKHFSEADTETVSQVLAYIRHDPKQGLALRQEATLVAATLGMFEVNVDQAPATMATQPVDRLAPLVAVA